MTIETTGNKIAYIGNGVATDFNFNFSTSDIAHIIVLVNAVQVAATVTLNLDQVNSPGGLVQTAVAPANMTRVTIVRILDLVQTTDYPISGDFPSASHEAALDDLVSMAQQQQEQIDRKLGVDVNDDGTTDLTFPAYVARRGFVYDASAKKIILTTNDPDQTADDAIAAAAAANASAAAAAADVLLTNADVVATGNDVAATNQDVLTTGNDVGATNANVALTTADLAATNQDKLGTAADLAATNQDKLGTTADLAATNQDTLDTAADAGLTASDVVTTNNDVLISNANAQSAFGSKQQALASENQAGLYAAQAGAAAGIIVEHPFILGTSAYSGTLGITSYVIDATYNVVVLQTNTTNASTLNFDGLGPIPIKLLNSGDPYIGAIHEGIIAKFTYDGVNMRLLNPHSSWPTFMSRTTAGPNAVVGPTVVPYDNVQMDTNLNYNNITYKYKPTERGYYMVYAQLRVSGLVIGDFVHLSITRDAVNGIPEARSSIIAKDTSAFLKVGPFPMYFDGNTLDEVWIIEENQTGTSHAFDSTDAANWFSVTKISH